MSISEEVGKFLKNKGFKRVSEGDLGCCPVFFDGTNERWYNEETNIGIEISVGPVIEDNRNTLFSEQMYEDVKGE